MTVKVRMSPVIPWLVWIAATAVGAALGFVIKPFVTWFVNLLGDAPGPLRAAAALPTAWAVPVLTVVGAAVGWWLAHAARKESLELSVGPEHVQLTQNGASRHIPRNRIAEAFLDGKDLVLLDTHSKELARNRTSDLRATNIANAFNRFEYPWRGTSHPFEAEFQPWIDGHPDLAEGQHRLLRSRAHALKDDKLGTAAELAEQLQAVGVNVRDRGGSQQYRSISASRTESSQGNSAQ